MWLLDGPHSPEAMDKALTTCLREARTELKKTGYLREFLGADLPYFKRITKIVPEEVLFAEYLET